MLYIRRQCCGYSTVCTGNLLLIVAAMSALPTKFQWNQSKLKRVHLPLARLLFGLKVDYPMGKNAWHLHHLQLPSPSNPFLFWFGWPLMVNKAWANLSLACQNATLTTNENWTWCHPKFQSLSSMDHQGMITDASGCKWTLQFIRE